MNAPMDLESALARVRGLLPALEKLLAPDAMLAFRTVYDAANGSAIADVLRGMDRLAAEALRERRREARVRLSPPPRLPVDEEPPPEANALTTPHLFLGNGARPCCLCDRPKSDPLHDMPSKDHDIHPNRGTP